MCAEQHFVRSVALGCIKVPSGASKSEIPVQTSQIKEMFVSVVVGVLMLSACTPGLVQTWEMIGRALCVHGSGSFDRPACNGPDPGPAK